MLWACVLEFQKGWNTYIPLVKFAYNNSFHSSIGIALYEALYGRKYRSLIHWDDMGERKSLGLVLVQRIGKAIENIRKRMLTAQSRQKSYADVRRRKLEFNVGDMVFLKVAPMKGVMRFGKKGKLSPLFIGPFEILERVGKVAYKLALPPSLASVHNVFHVSMLKKYIQNLSHVLSYKQLELGSNLFYEEQPIQILDKEEKQLRNRKIPLVKVLWKNHSVEEATWEHEDEMRKMYPTVFG